MSQEIITQSERVYRALNPDGDPFKYNPELEKELDIIGLTLWATEGDRTQLSLANGSPAIIKKYLEFLRRICSLKEEKIRLVIHCHDTMLYADCVAFWSNITKISKERFKKPYIKKDKGGKRKYPYGICRIVASNMKLVQIFNKRLIEIGLTRT